MVEIRQFSGLVAAEQNHKQVAAYTAGCDDLPDLWRFQTSRSASTWLCS